MSTPKNHGDMPAEDFRKYGYQLIDWIADFFAEIDKHAVLPNIQPGDIVNKLPHRPPVSSESMDKILSDIDKVIMPGMTHWNHPNFFAYFSSSGSAPGVLGELIGSAFNINGMVWQSCPSSTELEKVTMDWLRQLLGLPEEYWGIIYDTASTSNLHAIAAAREQLTDLKLREKGMCGRTDVPRLRIYLSEHAHSSVDKAAITLGFGMDSICKIPVDESFRMKPSLLQEAIQADRSKGWRPFCVVATIGTTSTTSVDPTSEIADICERENLWLHVDAAYGGSAAILPEKRDLFYGWERADSIVMNPHKWMFVPIDLSAFYTRKPALLRQAFSLVPEYLKTEHDEVTDNFMDYGFQLGRRFRSLKLWFVLRYFGQEGLASRIRYHLELAKEFIQLVEDHPLFEVMAPAPFSTVCFRFHPEGTDDENKLNQLNKKLLQAINATHQIFLSHTKLGETYIIRFAISNLRTEKEHVERAWKLIQTEAQKLIDSFMYTS